MNFIATALLLSALTASQQTQWPEGIEREVDEGVYMQVADSQHGWRVWRTESRNGVVCKAVKSARGREHPIPVGVGPLLFRGTPFLEIHGSRHGFSGREIFSYDWTTRHYGRVAVKYRIAGERFYEEKSNGEFSASGLTEGSYDVVLISWEYPALNIGRAEEAAIFDMTGREWAEQRVLQCQDDAKPS